MELRTITCDVKDCKNRHTEKAWGEGHPGWGSLKGIVLDGQTDPHLCPQHLHRAADFIDSLRGS